MTSFRRTNKLISVQISRPAQAVSRIWEATRARTPLKYVANFSELSIAGDLFSHPFAKFNRATVALLVIAMHGIPAYSQTVNLQQVRLA